MVRLSDHEERILYYQSRAELNLPLFGDGPSVPNENYAFCDGCGTRAPRQTWLTRIGWTCLFLTGDRCRLTFCPLCANS